MLQLYLVMCKNHPGGNGCEGMKASWRTAEAWYCESPWKAIGESVPSVVIDSPGLKGSCKGMRLSTVKKAYERLWWSIVAVEDPSILEMPVPWDDHQEQQWQWRGSIWTYSANRGQSWRSDTSSLEMYKRSCVDLRHWNKKGWSWNWLGDPKMLKLPEPQDA